MTRRCTATSPIWSGIPGSSAWENRVAAQLAASSNDILFKEDFGPFPKEDETVAVVGPDRGFYGPFTELVTRSSHLNTVAGSIEDRLKLTPTFA